MPKVRRRHNFWSGMTSTEVACSLPLATSTEAHIVCSNKDLINGVLSRDTCMMILDQESVTVYNDLQSAATMARENTTGILTVTKRFPPCCTGNISGREVTLPGAAHKDGITMIGKGDLDGTGVTFVTPTTEEKDVETRKLKGCFADNITRFSR